MPTTMGFSVSPLQAGGGRRIAPRKLFRKMIRTELRNSIAKLKVLFNHDERERRRGAALAYTPSLVFGRENTSLNNAAKRVLSRLVDCMALMEGQE